MSCQNHVCADLILVGCVKSKVDYPAQARCLYKSPLWNYRREYAECLGCAWYILSAKHGLLDPLSEIEPYDLALSDMSAAERREWSERVLADLVKKHPSLSGKVVEIHAGKPYAEHGLEDGLIKMGATVCRPLKHMRGIGSQIAWYKERLAAACSHARRNARLAEKIAGDFYGDGFDLSARDDPPSGAWTQMPEVKAVRKLRDLGASDREVRLFLTFISAMDRARDANRLWCAGYCLFKSRPELFEPDIASSIEIETLRKLLSESGVSQRHEQDAKAWSKIARSLSSGHGPVRRVIDDGIGDACKLLEDLRSESSSGCPRFPLLKGRKIGPMWVRMIAWPGGAKIDRIGVIPVAVDVHVRRVTENLGVTDTRHLRLEQARPCIQSAWHKAVSLAKIGGPPEIEGTCAALDPALWFFGKYGCSHCEKVGSRVPIGRACDSCQFPFPPETEQC